MIDKDGSMVGVEKLDTKPMLEWRLDYIQKHLSPRPLFHDNNRISYVGLKMGVRLGKDGRWFRVCRFRKAIRFRRSRIDTVFRPTFRFSRPTNDKRVSLGFVS